MLTYILSRTVFKLLRRRLGYLSFRVNPKLTIMKFWRQ